MTNEEGAQAQIYLNGIDGETGEYLVPPLTLEEAAGWAMGEPKDKTKETGLKKIWRVVKGLFLGLPMGVDPGDVNQAGWGIVFLADEDEAVKKAFEPLIEHRRKLIANDDLVKVLEFRTGDSWKSWLAGYGVAPGVVKPTKIPYYLLLVGDPQKLPFTFGQLLDTEYAVGRLHFDKAEDYAQYVASVIAYETADSVANTKEAVFFGPRHAFDAATKMSADLLVNPLADGVPAKNGEPAQPGVAEWRGFKKRKLWGDQATKQALLDVVCSPTGQSTPAVLFTASHGMGFAKGHASQRAAQGALLCQDWPGFGTISPAHYLAAADVPTDARVHGMVMFHFACYGGGTPERDLFLQVKGKQPPQIADAAFLAALPKAWLTHPQGGALACIGHVERAWGYSIVPQGAGPQLQSFQNALGWIMSGLPVGHALKDFNERYAVLSTDLTDMLQQAGHGVKVDSEQLAINWIERNDAEGYVLIGDPAVRLRTADLQVQ